MNRILLLLLLTSLVILQSCAPKASTPPTPAAAETKEQRDTRMAWWRQARFGMFIHWGIYSVPAGTYQGKQIPSLGEWLMNNANATVADYAKFTAQFNPTEFNADQWVAIAKNAGMKYIVITAKHHDGFAMFKSKASPYNIVDATPFKRDVIKELDDAARRAGLRFGVYYSQSQDWHHPGGFAYGRNGRKNGDHWDPAQDGPFEDYINKIAIPQTRELLTNYKLDVLWWDTSGSITHDQATKLHHLLALQPNIISNNRLGGGYKGDTETPEQTIPPTGFPDRDWETCMTINDTWGYKSYDTKFKSTETLLRNLIDIASKGGNYLLNVGPTAQGIIPQPEVERLAAMGQWLKVNGEAIYGCGPTAFGPEAGNYLPPLPTTSTAPAATRAATQPRFVATWDWRCTTKPGKLYIEIFKWPGTKFELANVKGTITNAYLLADPLHQPLTVSQTQGKAAIALPATAPDPIASVLCLEVQNP